MKEFIKSDKYGQLYLDRVLFESYFPIIFTCINDNSEIFICVCCQNNKKGCKWLLGKTSGINVVRMLRDEITLRQLLVECSSGRISVDYIQNEYKISYNNSDWDENSVYLPKADSYMYAEDGEFEDDISYFSSVDYVFYDAEHYKRIVEALGTISKKIEPMTEALNIFASVIGNITIPSEVISTMEVIGELSTDPSMNTEKYMNQYKIIYNDTFTSTSQGLSIIVESDNNDYLEAA